MVVVFLGMIAAVECSFFVLRIVDMVIAIRLRKKEMKATESLDKGIERLSYMCIDLDSRIKHLEKEIKNEQART